MPRRVLLIFALSFLLPGLIGFSAGYLVTAYPTAYSVSLPDRPILIPPPDAKHLRHSYNLCVEVHLLGGNIEDSPGFLAYVKLGNKKHLLGFARHLIRNPGTFTFCLDALFTPGEVELIRDSPTVTIEALSPDDRYHVVRAYILIITDE